MCVCVCVCVCMDSWRRDPMMIMNEEDDGDGERKG